VIELLAPAFVTCLLLAGVLGYFGLHVLLREVIFVDLALAQIAALGVAVAHLVASEASPAITYLWSFAFTLAGAAIFAGVRTDHRRVPQEAMIGIVYGVSAALVILVLSKSALDRDEIESMLTGRLLFVAWTEVGLTALVCAAVAALHVLLRRTFLEISRRSAQASPPSRRERGLDFVFYASFGVVVTSSVQIAGVLVVFSLLIVPAACAALFLVSLGGRLLGGWAIGTLAGTVGVVASALWDLPTGPSVVAVLGAAFAMAVGLSAIRGGPWSTQPSSTDSDD
jgi:zinc/manganese transport system permease protein